MPRLIPFQSANTILDPSMGQNYAGWTMSKIVPLNRKITLPALSWKIIKELLNAPGWASTPRQIVTAGKIDRDDTFKLPELPKPVAPATAITKDQDERWCRREISLELTDKQVEVIKDAINHFIAQKAVPTGRFGLAIVETFLGDE